MYVAPGAAGLLIFTSVFSWAHFFTGPLVPKLRNGRVPDADLSSYQHSEPRHKLPRAFFSTGLSNVSSELVRDRMVLFVLYHT